MTTVGYGDITPSTPLGKFITTLLVLIGYSLIIVPTGILSAEIRAVGQGGAISTQVCPSCMREGHDGDASHCKYCGGEL
jgi:voltage-gated potassium channel